MDLIMKNYPALRLVATCLKLLVPLLLILFAWQTMQHADIVVPAVVFALFLFRIAIRFIYKVVSMLISLALIILLLCLIFI